MHLEVSNKTITLNKALNIFWMEVHYVNHTIFITISGHVENPVTDVTPTYLTTLVISTLREVRTILIFIYYHAKKL